MKRIISFSLALLMLLSMFVGCTKDEQVENEDTAEVSTGNELEGKYPDTVGDATFDGAECILLTRDKDYLSEYWGAEGADASMLDAAVYARNVEVQERLDITLTQLTKDLQEVQVFIRNDALSGDQSFHIVGSYAYVEPMLALEGLFYNIKDIPYINLSYPWYSEKFVNAATISDKLFMVACDWGYSQHENTGGTLVNYDMLKRMGITDDLTSVVLDGKWTLEYFKTLVANSWQDDNGDGIQDANDTYGLMVSRGMAPVDLLMFGVGYKFSDFDANGNLVAVMNSAMNVDRFEAVHNLFHKTDGVMYNEKYFLDMPIIDSFVNEKTIFAFQPMYQVRQTISATEFDYGCLPMPKYDDNQSEYLSFVQDSFSLMSVSYKVTNLEMVGAVMETMSRKTYIDIRPVLFENIYETRYSENEQEAAVYDIILNSGAFDFIAIHTVCLDQPFFKVRSALQNSTNTYASTMKSYNTQLGVRTKILLDNYKKIGS